MLAALKAVGHPEKRLPPVIHIAGTNGKGSTLAYLKAILEAAGYKVHRYTSPHLVEFNERIELGGKPIDDTYLYKTLEEARLKTEGINLTFFEGTTLAAFMAFAETPANIVLLETGMGGRLDATNIVDSPLLTIITPISMDHTEFLGTTLKEIAGEKAAIIKQGRPCISAPQLPDAKQVIEAEAVKKKAPLTFANLSELPLGLLGEHQKINAGVAIAAIPHLTGFNITDEYIREGLLKANWPARLQKITLYGRELWLDGGHNPAAGEMIAAWAKDNHFRVYLICGMLSNKDMEGFMKPIAPYIDILTAIPIPDEEKSATPEELAGIATRLGIKSTTAPDVKTALANVSGTILIAGSLYLAGSVLAETR